MHRNKKNPLESFIAIHERHVTRYLEDNPGASLNAAYVRTRDAAWAEMTDQISERSKQLNEQLSKIATSAKDLKGDKILDLEIEKQTRKEFLQQVKKK